MTWHKRGQVAESFFSNLLYTNGLNYNFVDKWYDYEVEGLKVEVKSCQLSISNRDAKVRYHAETDYFQVGRFDFHNGGFWEGIKSENIWIALVVKHRTQCLLYGFIESKNLPKTRYLSLHKARSLKPITFEDWISENNLKCKNRICPFCGREILKAEPKEDN